MIANTEPPLLCCCKQEVDLRRREVIARSLMIIDRSRSFYILPVGEVGGDLLEVFSVLSAHEPSLYILGVL